jgi:hypothetical protein
MAVLNGLALSAEIDDDAAALNFLANFGGRCGH